MQNYEVSRSEIEARFRTLKAEHPERFQRRLEMSWSNWGFGLERLEKSCARLADAGLDFIELHVRSLNIGAAHGALGIPTPGDTSMATSTKSSIWVAGARHVDC